MLTEDEGYYFGIGAFETIAVEDGDPQFLEKHLRRLERAMDFLGIGRDAREIRERARQALAGPELRRGRKAMKITVSPKNLTVTVRDNPYGPEDYQRGFAAMFSPVRRNETSPLVYHKTLNYGDCILEKRNAKKLGVDEPVFLNTRGEIAEGAATNVFFIRGGTIVTPAKACGLLPGIIREVLMEACPVEERRILPQEIGDYDEMFLTNSLLGIMPVRCIGEHRFPGMERSRELSRALGLGRWGAG